MQVAGSVLFANAMEPGEPIDASIGCSDIPAEAGGYIINDLKHTCQFQTPNENKMSYRYQERALLEVEML
jgi:hypothetical protein